MTGVARDKLIKEMEQNIEYLAFWIFFLTLFRFEKTRITHSEGSWKVEENLQKSLWKNDCITLHSTLVLVRLIENIYSRKTW